MKVTTLILMFLSLSAAGQITLKSYLKTNGASMACMFGAGVANGTAELLVARYDDIDRAFGLNDKFWNPRISWKNKYKNGDPKQGERFFLSTTALVCLTDGYHLTRMLRGTFICGAVIFKLTQQRQKWYWYAIDFIVYSIVYKTGFWLTYEIIDRI